MNQSIPQEKINNFYFLDSKKSLSQICTSSSSLLRHLHLLVLHFNPKSSRNHLSLGFSLPLSPFLLHSWIFFTFKSSHQEEKEPISFSFLELERRSESFFCLFWIDPAPLSSSSDHCYFWTITYNRSPGKQTLTSRIGFRSWLLLLLLLCCYIFIWPYERSWFWKMIKHILSYWRLANGYS